MAPRVQRLCVGLMLMACGLVASAAGDVIDNDANAMMLATQAKGLVQHTSRGGIEDQNDRLRNSRGSAVTPQHREAECGGIAIGNVRPSRHHHGHHETTVIIRGNVVNSGNKC